MGEHGGEIFEGERNGYYVLVWKCVCGAKGKGSATMLQAVNGLRKHCGVPAITQAALKQRAAAAAQRSRW